MLSPNGLVSQLVVTRCRRWSQAAGISVAAFGIVALLSQWANLRRLPAPWGTLKGNAALCFVLLGVALWLFVVKPRGRRQALRQTLAAASLVIAALTLSQDLFRWNLGIDELLLVDPVAVDRGRMAPNTALLLGVISVAILRLKDTARVFYASQWLGLVTAVSSLVILCGYLYGVDALYVVPGFGSLPLDTALCFLLLGTGTMVSKPDRGLLAVFTAETVGGMLFRRLLPVIILVPVGLGWLTQAGLRAGLYGTTFAAALFAVSSVLTIVAIMWLITRQLNDSELQRRSAHQDLAESRRMGRLAEDALRRSQQLIQALIDNSSSVVYVKDLEGRYLMVNRSFTDLFKVDADRALGLTDYDVFPRDQADAFRAMDQRVAAAGSALTEEEPVELGGAVRTYMSVKSPLTDESGRVYAVFGISTDITERKQAEAQLRASEERMRVIVETSLDAVITLDAEGIITGWNPRAEQIFGWTHDEVIGRPLAETVIPEQYREAHRLGLSRYASTGEGSALGTRLELSGLHRDGREFPVELSIAPVNIGGALSFSGFVRDISRRKAMERALLESQQYYRALSESLPNLVWTCRPDGSCDYLSRQWVDYTGRPAEEQLGFGWAEQIHPADRSRVKDEWERALVRGDSFDSEFRIRRADGAYRWFKTRALPLRDGSGIIVKWFGSNTDFEDYKQFQDRLQEQLKRMTLLDDLTRSIGERQDLSAIFRVVLGSLEEHLAIDFGCVCLHDRADDALVVTVVGSESAVLADQLGLQPKTRIPMSHSGLAACVRGELVYEENIANTSAPFLSWLARAGLQSVVAAPFVLESQLFGVLVTARHGVGFNQTDGEFLRQLSKHVALAVHQAELYNALQSAYDDLRLTQQAVTQQERLKALGQMASGIAHDINNAISPVVLYTETLLDTEPDLSPRARKYLSTIQRAIGDVAQTVARMREFYRHQQPQFVLVPMSANRLVREVVELTRARWSDMPQQRGVVVALTTDLAPADPMILGLESDVRESLINLIFNAVDAMPEGGTLVIRTRVVDEGDGSAGSSRRAAIEVSDTGIGMDAETRRRCLEPFFTTKGERGTGLGLAMVYGMVQRHDAEIDIESSPGRGTLVRITFAMPQATTEPAAAPNAGLPRSSLKVLVVDDDPLLLRSLQDVLEGDGHSVSAAAGGELGIAMFRKAHHEGANFNVVITDLGMPHIDGRQVASAVKETNAEMPVILLTGWGQRLVDESEVPAHVNRVLRKPPRLSELRQALVELTSAGTTP